MLRSLTQFRRALSFIGILAILMAGLFSVTAPVHANGTPTSKISAQAPAPCHHAAGQDAHVTHVPAFDYCKERCLASSPDRFQGFAVTGHKFSTKATTAFRLPPSGVYPVSSVVRTPVRYNPDRSCGAVPDYVLSQRLLI